MHRLRTLLIGRSSASCAHGTRPFMDIARCRERPLTALGRSARQKYAILLAVALLFAQFVLIAHQIDHQSHESHASKTLCHLCLTAQHLGSTPISKDNPPVIVHGQDSIAFSAVVGLLSSRIITGFFARAPPFFLHA